MNLQIGERLAELREDHQWGQKELAAMLGVKSKTISDYENDTTTPSTQVLIKMAQLYNVSLDFLTGLTDKQTPVEQKCVIVLPKDFPADAIQHLDIFIKFLMFEYGVE